MNHVSFMSANFVARQVGYHMTQGWGEGDRSAQAWFSPLATFEARFDEMLGEITALGFTHLDLWTAHLHYQWATPEHLAIARRLLAARRLAITSYAGWFGEQLTDLRAACRVCTALDIPVLGGNTALLSTHRAALVATLREFGLVFALENHPEKNPAELVAKLGAGDEDIIGVALDTGWFGTQRYDALAALRELAPRVKHLHLKDVKAPRAEKTGFDMIDRGHETCCLGAGIVPVELCVKLLPSLGYRGAIGIEHEPEDFDPRPDAQASRLFVEEWLRAGRAAVLTAAPLRVAIVGCGNISGAYARNLAPYPEVKIVGAQDLDGSRAEAFVKQYSAGRAYPTLDAVLADPEVDAVVNLTIYDAHVEVITRCLEGGKHVHSEKPIATTYADAHRLVELAAAKNLRLSAAPITWMGEAQQTAWKLIREGRIGTPRVAYAEVNWGRIESWHPNPAPFYQVGPIFDVAVYPLTLLTAWFGPAKRVVADGGVVFPHRVTKEGKPFSITTPEWSCAVVELASGLRARVTTSFYVGWNSRQKGLEVHGDQAMIALDRWDVFDTPLWFGALSDGDKLTRIPPLRVPVPSIEFGRGVVELAHALRENRPHRAQGAHAAHVVDIIGSIHACLRDGQPRTLSSTFPAPSPMDWAR
jgi:predicted dehydrogenase/sugar phosphate isomerase/epimerase